MGGDVDGHDIDLSKRQVKKVMRGVNDRVSDDAAIQMAYDAQERIQKKTRAAQMVAQQNGRVTIKEEDVRLVENIVDEFVEGL